MNKLICLFLLVGGIIAVVYGFNASQSVASSFSRLFTGQPTDHTVWLLLGGGIAMVLGVSGLLRDAKIL
ncbi:MAG TPA: DUF3185 family protein [Opitutaceae bacterium]|nr:DUF3185 family protein [Opitutaceae bacterium]